MNRDKHNQLWMLQLGNSSTAWNNKYESKLNNINIVEDVAGIKLQLSLPCKTANQCDTKCWLWD